MDKKVSELLRKTDRKQDSVCSIDLSVVVKKKKAYNMTLFGSKKITMQAWKNQAFISNPIFLSSCL